MNQENPKMNLTKLLNDNIAETITKYISTKNPKTTQRYNIEFTWFKGVVYVRNLTLQKNLGEYDVKTNAEFDELVASFKGYY